MANILVNSLNFPNDTNVYLTGKVRTVNGVAPNSNGELTVDSAPTSGSDNLVSSDGIYSVTHQNAENIATNTSDITSLKSAIETKADIDGAYPDLVAGGLMSSSGTAEEVPYNFRKAGGSVEAGSAEVLEKIVGGTIAWNQLMPVSQVSSVSDQNGVAWTNNEDGTWTANGTASANSSITIIVWANSNAFKENHKYLIKLGYTDAQWASYRTEIISRNSNDENAVYVDLFSDTIVNSAKNGTKLYCELRVYSGVTATNFKFSPQIFDLTQMFGSTVADYLYTLEQGTAGAGVAFFRSLFPKSYYAYNAGELMSVNTSAHNTVGFNQWDEEYEVGQFNPSTGEPQTASDAIRSKNLIPILPNTTYYLYAGATSVSFRLFYLDSNGDLISTISLSSNQTFTTPENVNFMKFHTSTGYGTTYNNDICINISDTDKNGTYEPYDGHSYALDSSLELRGIPKLDDDNNIYYDGDTYESDGTVTRKYGIVDLGTLAWTYDGVFAASISGMKQNAYTSLNLMCAKYPTMPMSVSAFTYGIRYSGGNSSVMVKDSAYTDAAAFKTAMSGVYLVYELATSTTETADEFTEVQIVNADGTEEFVDYAESQGTRDVAIPVGHYTEYPTDLVATLEEILDTPTTDGTYTLQATVFSGTVTYSWVSA